MIEPPDPRRREHRAILMLLIASAIWGMGFNWNKQAQAILGQRLAEVFGDPTLTQLGPACFLAIRFLLAGIIWILVFPRALRGWSKETWRGGAYGGVLLASGMILQHYGLARASESLTAFLTSLTVLFTPIITFFFLRHRVGGWMWLCVALATTGIALMTFRRREAGFDLGALLGLLCAVVFSVHILIIDHFGKRQDAWRFTLAQFLFATVVFTGFALVWPGGPNVLRIEEFLEVLLSTRLLILLAVIVLPGTILTFGLMFRFQPDTSPTRAALTYLSEPIFAATYAWVFYGTRLTRGEMIGAAMILIGNMLAELFGRKPKTEDTQTNSFTGVMRELAE